MLYIHRRACGCVRVCVRAHDPCLGCHPNEREKTFFQRYIWPIHFFVVYLYCDSKKGIRRLRKNGFKYRVKDISKELL